MARGWIGTAGALLRCSSWAVLLHVVDRPWRELGGVLGERQRWLERVALGMALVVGWTLGVRPPRAGRLRWVGPAAAVALGMLALAIRGARSWILLLLVAWLAYCAGLDLAERAWPLLREDGDGEDEGDLRG